MTTLRVIKKYPNRRLYDTGTSCYITLKDVKQLVLDYVEFKVVDKASEKDITASTLLQIISEEEISHDGILSSDVLKQMIRYYGDSMQAMMSRFLSDMMNHYMTMQAQLKAPISPLTANKQVSGLKQITKESLLQWHHQQIAALVEKD